MKISMKAARVNAGLKFADAAKKLGISGTTLAKYEDGRTVPNAMTIYKIEDAYNIKFEDIDFSRQQNTQIL